MSERTNALGNNEGNRNDNQENSNENEIPESIIDIDGNNMDDESETRVDKYGISTSWVQTDDPHKIFAQKHIVVEQVNIQPYRSQLFPEIEFAPNLPHEPSRRTLFLKKVLLVTLMMIVVTAVGLACAITIKPLRDFFIRTHLVYFMVPTLSVILGTQIFFLMTPYAKHPPFNFIALSFTVIVMTTTAAKISVYYDTLIVAYATMASAAVVFVCLCLAYTRFDFTRFILYLIAVTVAFCMVSMILIWIKVITGFWMKIESMLSLGCACIIEAMFMVLVLQSILGGRSIEMADENYGLAAWLIYIAILDSFIKMVQLVGLCFNQHAFG